MVLNLVENLDVEKAEKRGATMVALLVVLLVLLLVDW